MRRLPVVATAAAFLALGLVLDSTATNSHQLQPTAVPSAVATSSTMSSTWFCAGANAVASTSAGAPAPAPGPAPGYIVVTDVGSQSIHGLLTLVSNAGESATQPFVVTSGASVQLVESLPKQPWVGAIVDLDGGSAAVYQTIHSSNGTQVQPCATAASPQWYFADGTTVRGANDYIAILNPYPQDAIVDVSAVTEQGLEQPDDLQGVVVSGKSLVVLDLSATLPRRTSIALSVIARTGDVVAWQTEVVAQPKPGVAVLGAPVKPGEPAPIDPVAPVGGTVLLLGAPRERLQMWWPYGYASGALTERYVIYNPNKKLAQVRLGFNLTRGSATPFELTVPADSVISVVTNSSPRLPLNDQHSAVLTSLNDVPVVAERTISAEGSAVTGGLGAILGVATPVRSWLVPPSTAPADWSSTVTVMNVSGREEHLKVLVNGASTSVLVSSAVPVGGSYVVHVPTAYVGAALQLSSTGEMVVEQDLAAPPGTSGLSLSPATPFS